MEEMGYSGPGPVWGRAGVTARAMEFGNPRSYRKLIYRIF